MKTANLLYLLFIFLLFTACEKDTDETVTRLTVTEESMTPDIPVIVTNKEEFTYKNKELVQYVSTQQYDQQAHTSTPSGLTYTHNSVIIKTGDQVCTYHLNKNNLAEQCKFTEPGTDNTRLFDFAYNSNNQLVNMVEYLNGELNRKITFEYNNNNISRYLIEDSSKLIENARYSYENTDMKNLKNVPFIPLIEKYPVNLHKIAIYAGLLGAHTRQFPTYSFYEGNDEEKVIFQYSSDESGFLKTFDWKVRSGGKDYYKRHFTYTYN